MTETEFARTRQQRIAAERVRAEAEQRVREAEEAQRRAEHEEAVERLDGELLSAQRLGEQIAEELLATADGLKTDTIETIAHMVRLGDRLSRAESAVLAAHAEASKAARQAGLAAPSYPARPGRRVHDRRDDIGEIAQAATGRRHGSGAPGDDVLARVVEALRRSLAGGDIARAE